MFMKLKRRLGNSKWWFPSGEAARFHPADCLWWKYNCFPSVPRGMRPYHLKELWYLKTSSQSKSRMESTRQMWIKSSSNSAYEVDLDFTGKTQHEANIAYTFMPRHVTINQSLFHIRHLASRFPSVNLPFYRNNHFSAETPLAYPCA